MEALRYARIELACGAAWVAWTSEGRVMSAPGDGAETRFVADVDRALGVRPVRDAAAGAPVDVDLRLVSGAFRRAVLGACATIPAGEVRSYGELAAMAGRPRAARAVGTAMATNPLPLVIPCHRVIRSDGTLGEYGAGGARRKARLLRAEGVAVGGIPAGGLDAGRPVLRSGAWRPSSSSCTRWSRSSWSS